YRTYVTETATQPAVRSTSHPPDGTQRLRRRNRMIRVRISALAGSPDTLSAKSVAYEKATPDKCRACASTRGFKHELPLVSDTDTRLISHPRRQPAHQSSVAATQTFALNSVHQRFF